ncbi:hypothetical protein CKO15_07000 [Halorhodospira abdelmalekii]|nr:hypothetical protein [Halorhodospira abdelmalekii]
MRPLLHCPKLFRAGRAARRLLLTAYRVSPLTAYRLPLTAYRLPLTAHESAVPRHERRTQ